MHTSVYKFGVSIGPNTVRCSCSNVIGKSPHMVNLAVGFLWCIQHISSSICIHISPCSKVMSYDLTLSVCFRSAEKHETSHKSSFVFVYRDNLSGSSKIHDSQLCTNDTNEGDIQRIIILNSPNFIIRVIGLSFNTSERSRRRGS
jgi:hypothetical protein